jgi:hypothetical protein
VQHILYYILPCLTALLLTCPALQPNLILSSLGFSHPPETRTCGRVMQVSAGFFFCHRPPPTAAAFNTSCEEALSHRQLQVAVLQVAVQPKASSPPSPTVLPVKAWTMHMMLVSASINHHPTLTGSVAPQSLDPWIPPNSIHLSIPHWLENRAYPAASTQPRQ